MRLRQIYLTSIISILVTLFTFTSIGFSYTTGFRNETTRLVRGIVPALKAPLISVEDYPRLDVPSHQYGVLLNVGKFLGDMNRIPEGVLSEIEEVLSQAKKDGAVINSYKLTPVSKDIFIQVSTWEKDGFSNEVYTLIREAVLEGLKEAQDEGILVDSSILQEQDPNTQLERLQLRVAQLGETPRKAEPNGVMILEGSAPGGANFLLNEIYCSSVNTAGINIDPAMKHGFIFDIADLKTAVTINGRTYYKTYSIRTKGEEGQNKIEALISDPNRFVITRVKKSGPDGLPVSDEPVAVVSLDYFGNPEQVGGSFNTVVMYRAQSGLPAVGEYVMALRKARLLPAGTLNMGVAPHYRPAMPVGLEELASGSAGNFVRVAIYGYQLGKEGAIPDDPDSIKVSTGHPSQHATVEEAQKLAGLVERMQGFIPDLTPEYANALATQVRDEYANRFQVVPESEATGEGENTVSLIKADIGSSFGHIGVPQRLKDTVALVLEAAKTGGEFTVREFIKEVPAEEGEGKVEKRFVESILEAAVEAGVLTYKQIDTEVVKGKELPIYQVRYNDSFIDDYKVFNAGDDTETLIYHKHGTESPIIHRYVSMLGFLKGTNVAVDMGLYGAGQDLLSDAPAGNVRGAGPGVAEKIIGSDANPVDIIAMDKTSPMAYNVLAKEMGERALHRDPNFDAVYEIWWLEEGETKKAYFDLRTEKHLIDKLLSSYDHVAVKRVHRKSKVGWNPAKASEYLGEVLAVFSTDKLAHIAGKYVGKDDPVAIFDHEFANLGGLRDSFMNPWIVEGGMRGSHRMVIMPIDKEHSDPSINDGPPLAVGLQVGLRTNGDGEVVGFHGGVDEFIDDFFSGSEWTEVVKEVSRLNNLLYSQYAPYRLSGEAAEYTTLKEILAELADDPSARYEPLPMTVLEYLSSQN